MEDVTSSIETQETEVQEQQDQVQQFNEEEFTKRLEDKFNARLEEFKKQFEDIKAENENLKADKRKNEVVEMLRAADIDTRAIELLDINAADIEEKIKLLNDIIKIKVIEAIRTDMKGNSYTPGGNGPGGLNINTNTTFTKAFVGE